MYNYLGWKMTSWDPALMWWVETMVDQFFIGKNGLVHHADLADEYHAVYLLDTLRETAMYEAHGHLMGGHSSLMKMLHRVKQRFYWPRQ